MNKKKESACTNAVAQRFLPKPKHAWLKLFGRAKSDEHSADAYQQGAEWRIRMNNEGR